MKAIIAMILGAFVLSACNTMEGFGQDVQAGGHAIEKSADRHK
ncbi:MAG TPA: entericidin A/B family lipoprotein [Usitatibacter sp.]|jgi:predicted small secreted protein